MPFRFPPIVVRLLSFTARKRHSFSTNAVGGGAARATAAPLQRTVTDSTDHTSFRGRGPRTSVLQVSTRCSPEGPQGSAQTEPESSTASSRLLGTPILSPFGVKNLKSV
jgi:hypothetical protein